MTQSSNVDAATVRAYEQTEYRVLGDASIVLRVGKACADLALLHEQHQTQCSAFVTACNPLGDVLDDTVNAERQQALAAQLARDGLVALPAVGQAASGSWPAEASFLVLGIERAAAQELGRQFQQNAIIWAGADAIPELILLR